MAAITNPIKYTSRTFNTILADINADPELADKPEWFKRIVAGVGDVLSMINNGSVNNNYLRTAFTRQAVVDLCYLIGYELPDATTSSGTMLFYFDADMTIYPIHVVREDLVGNTAGTVAISSRRFEARQDIDYTPEVIQSDNGTVVDSTSIVTRSCMTGEKVRLSGVVPAGLNAGQDYYVIKVSDTEIRYAKNPQDAIRNKHISFTPAATTPGFMIITFHSVRVTCYQQEFKADVLLGTSDAKTGWQEFDFPDSNILRDTLTITINSEPWKMVEVLTFSQMHDKDFQHIQLSERKSYIRFGDGVFGAVPENFPIIADYAVGGGILSNILQIGAVTSYAGSEQYIVGCFNATFMEGGGDPQGIEVAKRIAPGYLKSRDRFITVEDGENLAMSQGGISLARVIPNKYGVLTAQVVCVASGGGNPDDAHKQILQDYLISRTILNSIDVRVENSDIVHRDVQSAFRPIPGYDTNELMTYFRVGWKLFLSETGQEVLDEYQSTGIEGAMLVMNQNFGESLSVQHINTIETMLRDMLLDSNGDKYGRQYGETIQQSQIVSFIQGNIRGIEYMTIALPVFPLVHSDTGISSFGSMNLTII